MQLLLNKSIIVWLLFYHTKTEQSDMIHITERRKIGKNYFYWNSLLFIAYYLL